MLLSEIVKRDLSHYARTSTANTLTRFLNKHKEFDLIHKALQGKKALINEAYKPQAKKLESSGASEIEIWEKTGWYKDKDKKWKFEISQKRGELQAKDDWATI